MSWQQMWRGMPEFVQEDLTPYHTIRLNFSSEEELEQFRELAGRSFRRQTPNWWPDVEIGHYQNKRWVTPNVSPHTVMPQEPIYIVSKGRWDNQMTSRFLDEMGVPHYMVVEQQERPAYASQKCDSCTLLTLDPDFQRAYETFDDVTSKSKGPGPARNFAWWHAKSLGHQWHWVMDDNIFGFYRLNRNLKTPVVSPVIFRCMEDFVQRYENIPLAGPQYFMFVQRKIKQAPVVFNTRIYSCLLIRNDLPFRWRGRYNEDTDLSLRVLKAGMVTAQFNAFLQYKTTTQTLKGGNTSEFYDKEGTLPKSNILVRMHGDVARVAWRWGRWHHFVNYKPFANNDPRPRAGIMISDEVDNRGMVLEVDGKVVDNPLEHLPGTSHD